MTHRESRGSSGLREPGCLQVCLLPHLWLPSLLALPPSPVILSVIGTLCAVLFLCSTCSTSIALLLCIPFSFYVCLFCSLYFLPIPLPFSLPFGFVFSHHRKAFPCCSRLLSITFFQFRNQRKKDTLPSSSNYKNPETKPFYLSLHRGPGQGTVPQCSLGVKLEGNSNSLKEGRSSPGQTKH